MDHEEEFVRTRDEIEAEFFADLKRGWQAGHKRREQCPSIVSARMLQVWSRLPAALTEFDESRTEDTEFKAVDAAMSMLINRPARAGLWDELLPLEFGADADNSNFVLGFLHGFAVPMDLQAFLKLFEDAPV